MIVRPTRDRASWSRMECRNGSDTVGEFPSGAERPEKGKMGSIAKRKLAIPGLQVLSCPLSGTVSWELSGTQAVKMSPTLCPSSTPRRYREKNGHGDHTSNRRAS